MSEDFQPIAGAAVAEAPPHRLPEMLGLQRSGDTTIGCGVCRFGLVVSYDEGQQPTAYACACERGRLKQQAFEQEGRRLRSVSEFLSEQERLEYWPEGIPIAGKDRIATMLVAARIPPKFLPWSLASYAERFKGEREQKRYLKLAAEWIESPIEQRSDLIIYGPNGTGKTGMAIALARGLAERYQNTVFYTMRELSIAWRNTYRQEQQGADDQSEAEFLATLIEPSLLILDEVSGQRLSDFVEDTLTMIVDARQKLMKPSILTLNLPADLVGGVALEEQQLLTELLGPTLQDRLRERGQFWPMKGKSQRKTYTREKEQGS